MYRKNTKQLTQLTRVAALVDINKLAEQVWIGRYEECCRTNLAVATGISVA